jgi:hypothetical protein
MPPEFAKRSGHLSSGAIEQAYAQETEVLAGVPKIRLLNLEPQTS